MVVWVFCRDNRAPAGGRGVVFVGAPGGGPNSAAYARPQYGARRNGGPAGPSSIQAQIQENIARNAERAPEGPPQVNIPPPFAVVACRQHCVCVACICCCFCKCDHSRLYINKLGNARIHSIAFLKLEQKVTLLADALQPLHCQALFGVCLLYFVRFDDAS